MRAAPYSEPLFKNYRIHSRATGFTGIEYERARREVSVPYI